MKFTRILFVVIGSLVLLFLVVGFWPGADPNAPKFVPLATQPTGPFMRMDYDWGGEIPVRNDQLWVRAVRNSTNSHCFLYDFDSGLVKGELLRGDPVICNAERTKLLCSGYGMGGTLRWKLISWLKSVPWASRFAQRIHNEETFWILDLRDNSVRRVGQVFQTMGFGSRFVPSPSGRYGFNKPSTSWVEPEFFVCDLESNLFFKVQLAGEPKGWWDEQRILAKDPQNDFVLFDVVTRQTNVLFSAKAISNVLAQLSLRGSATELDAFSNWNGSDYDFFFAPEKEKNWDQSFVLRADRRNRELRLFSRDFKFQWLGRFDADETHYLYPGERGAPGTGGNGSVYLRNLTNNTTQTLVAPNNSGQYSLPRFCGDGVIYSSNRILRRVGVTGSNNVPLFR